MRVVNLANSLSRASRRSLLDKGCALGKLQTPTPLESLLCRSRHRSRYANRICGGASDAEKLGFIHWGIFRYSCQYPRHCYSCTQYSEFGRRPNPAGCKVHSRSRAEENTRPSQGTMRAILKGFGNPLSTTRSTTTSCWQFYICHNVSDVHLCSGAAFVQTPTVFATLPMLIKFQFCVLNERRRRQRTTNVYSVPDLGTTLRGGGCRPIKQQTLPRQGAERPFCGSQPEVGSPVSTCAPCSYEGSRPAREGRSFHSDHEPACRHPGRKPREGIDGHGPLAMSHLSNRLCPVYRSELGPLLLSVLLSPTFSPSRLGLAPVLLRQKTIGKLLGQLQYGKTNTTAHDDDFVIVRSTRRQVPVPIR